MSINLKSNLNNYNNINPNDHTIITNNIITHSKYSLFYKNKPIPILLFCLYLFILSIISSYNNILISKAFAQQSQVGETLPILGGYVGGHNHAVGPLASTMDEPILLDIDPKWVVDKNYAEYKKQWVCKPEYQTCVALNRPIDECEEQYSECLLSAEQGFINETYEEKHCEVKDIYDPNMIYK